MTAHDKYLYELEIQRLLTLTVTLMGRVASAEEVVEHARVSLNTMSYPVRTKLQALIDKHDAGKAS